MFTLVFLVWSLKANLKCFSTNSTQINGSYDFLKNCIATVLLLLFFFSYDAKVHLVLYCHMA